MSDVPQTTLLVPMVRLAGGIALIIGIISAIGVVFIIAMFVLFATPLKGLGEKFGMLNDICVALQYLLTIPVALVLYRILVAYNPILIRIATIAGIVGLLAVFVLQLALIFGVLTFQQQVVWVTLAMFLGVGFWLVMTGLVARSTGRLPNSIRMSLLAVPYVGYPVWAFWLGQNLLAW